MVSTIKLTFYPRFWMPIGAASGVLYSLFAKTLLIKKCKEL